MVRAGWATTVRRVIALSVIALAGCSLVQVPDIKDPEFRLEKIQVRELGLNAQRFVLTLAVDNPNRQSLPVRELSYRLRVGGLDFAEGHSQKAFTLAGEQTTTVDIEARTQLFGSLPQLSRMIGGGQRSFDYEISGDVEYGRFLRGSRSFERAGSVRIFN